MTPVEGRDENEGTAVLHGWAALMRVRSTKKSELIIKSRSFSLVCLPTCLVIQLRKKKNCLSEYKLLESEIYINNVLNTLVFFWEIAVNVIRQPLKCFNSFTVQ